MPHSPETRTAFRIAEKQQPQLLPGLLMDDCATLQVLAMHGRDWCWMGACCALAQLLGHYLRLLFFREPPVMVNPCIAQCKISAPSLTRIKLRLAFEMIQLHAMVHSACKAQL